MPSKPKRHQGKLKPRSNTIKATYRRDVKSWESDDFDADCQQAEVVIAELQQLFERSPKLGSITVKKQFGQKQGQKWASFSVELKRRDQQLAPSTFDLLAQQLWQNSQNADR